MHTLFRSTLTLAALAVPAIAAAQASRPTMSTTHSANTMMWGPFAGINFTTFGGADASANGVSSRTGFMAGVQLQRAMANNVFFRPGAMFSMRGADASGGFTVKINYLEIPMLFGYNFTMTGGSRVQPYVMAGPQIGFKLSCSASSSGGSTSCNNLGGEVKSFDWGLTGGGGISFPAGRGHLMIDARYYLGLQKGYSTADLKNRGFTIGVGYMMATR